MSKKKDTMTVEIHVPPASATREAKLKAYGIALALVDDLFDMDGAREKTWAAQVDASFQRFLKRIIIQTRPSAVHVGSPNH